MRESVEPRRRGPVDHNVWPDPPRYLGFRCSCGHLLRQEDSQVDGQVLWVHHGETLVSPELVDGAGVVGEEGVHVPGPACMCRARPGCGGVGGIR